MPRTALLSRRRPVTSFHTRRRQSTLTGTLAPSERRTKFSLERASAASTRACSPSLDRPSSPRRLCRSRQLRNQYPGRRRVRLHARLGHRRIEPDGDADPVALGQAGYRHRPEPGRGLPRPVSPPGRLGYVDHRRSGGDGDRPGRVSRRGARVQPALQHPPLPGGAPDRGGNVPDPRFAAVWLPAARSRDHGHGRRHRGLLHVRDAIVENPDWGAIGMGAVTPSSTAPRACCWPPASSARP